MGPRSVIDYALARRATLANLRAGRVSRGEVCDANPYLLRAARFHGEPSGRHCPVCQPEQDRRGPARGNRHPATERAASGPGRSGERAHGGLVHVTYGYGDELGESSGRAWASDELAELADRFSDLRIYVVEVCAVCGWNHLVTSYTIGTGGPPVRRGRRAAPDQ